MSPWPSCDVFTLTALPSPCSLGTEILFILSLPTSLPKAGSWNLSTKPLPSPAAVWEGLSGPVVRVREVGLFPAASLPIAQHQPGLLSAGRTLR